MESFEQREAGVLLHLSSLPGLGVMDHNARQFVDWLSSSGFRVWQVLPVGPTHADRSPYLSLSAHAGNAEFISLDEAIAEESLMDTWLLDFIQTQEIFSASLLAKNWQRYFDPYLLPGFDAFVERNHVWLDDYATFMMLRGLQEGKPWWQWPKALRDNGAAAVADEIELHRSLHDAYYVEQFLFDLQWRHLRAYANKAGVKLFGDLPLYVAHDSVDVWSNRHLFALDDDGEVVTKAGVPPDAFSETGQVWGNPVFRWDAHQAQNFQWWEARINTQSLRFDILRIDHFRGLQAYFEIPGADETAVNGVWQEAPGNALLAHLRKTSPKLDLVAEDLGLITPEVEALRKTYGLPGMRILEFSFDGGADNPHRVENHREDAVIYTGTHDNDTVVGWFLSLEPDLKKAVYEFFSITEEKDVLAKMVDATLSSPGYLAILPMQDILGLGSDARMNIPGTAEENWNWGFQWSQLRGVTTKHWKQRLLRLNRIPDFLSVAANG